MLHTPDISGSIIRVLLSYSETRALSSVRRRLEKCPSGVQTDRPARSYSPRKSEVFSPTTTV